MSTPKKKLFILDTNVLLVDPTAIENFEDNLVVVSMTVLEELDGLKNKPATQYEARTAINVILELTTRHRAGEIIELKSGGTLLIDATELKSKNAKGFDLNLDKPDNRLLSLALKFKSDKAFPDRIVIVSNDSAVRVKAHALGLASEEYQAVNYQRKIDDLYIKPREIELDEDQLLAWNSGKPVVVHDARMDQSALAVLPSGEFEAGYIENSEFFRYGGQIANLITPLNHQQSLALQMLFDPRKHIIALVGQSGTGKTVLALAAAIEQKLLSNTPGKIYIFRPNDQVGDEMGFLPGKLDEKFNPYKRAIRDAYEIIVDSIAQNKKGKRLPDFEHLTNDEGGGKMPILPINFIRGSTLHNAVMLIDEAQNFSAHQMKTLLTRAGRNTKVIITGDPDQIDNRFLTRRSCGLTHVIGNMRPYPLFTYINLTQGERSEIASLAAETL